MKETKGAERKERNVSQNDDSEGLQGIVAEANLFKETKNGRVRYLYFCKKNDVN